MKDYINALEEVEKEDEHFELTLSKKEVLDIVKEIERLNNTIDKIEKILNSKRDKMIMQQFDCDFEELLCQIDEEIREVLKELKENK